MAISRSALAVAVGAVHHVAQHAQTEVAPDRARSGLQRVGGTHHGADDPNGLGSLDHHREDRTGGDVLDQLAVEGLAHVLGVVLSRHLFGHHEQAGHLDGQTPALHAADDLSDQTPSDTTGLHQDKRTFDHFSSDDQARRARIF